MPRYLVFDSVFAPHVADLAWPDGLIAPTTPAEPESTTAAFHSSESAATATSSWCSDFAWFGLMERRVLRDTCALQVHRADDVQGGIWLPLVLEVSRGIRGRRLGAVQNYYTPDFRPISTSSAASELIPFLMDSVIEHAHPDVIELAPLDADAEDTRQIRHAFEQLGWPVRTEVAFANWVHAIDGSYDDYLATRDSRLRNTLKRKQKRLSGISGASLFIEDGTQDLDRAINAYRAVYEKSWKEPEPFPDFMPDLMREMAVRKQLRLGLIMIDDEPVAAHFWILESRCASIVKLAYDEAFARLSPGTVLMAAMLEQVIDRDGATRIDFLSGDDAYKRDWMSERREKLVLTAFNPRSIRGRIARARRDYLSPWFARLRCRAIGTERAGGQST